MVIFCGVQLTIEVAMVITSHLGKPYIEFKLFDFKLHTTFKPKYAIVQQIVRYSTDPYFAGYRAGTALERPANHRTDAGTGDRDDQCT